MKKKKMKTFNVFYTFPGTEHETLVTAKDSDEAVEIIKQHLKGLGYDEEEVRLRGGWEVK